MDPQILETAQQWSRLFLEWVGFGTVVGLLAKAIMPGRDPGGAVATLAMGIAGTIIGCGVFSFIYKGAAVTPISPLGLFLGTGGAFIILLFFRLLGGRWWHDEDRHVRRQRTRTRRARSHRTAYDPAYYDE